MNSHNTGTSYLEKETRTSRIQGQLLVLVNIVCALFYLGWCLLHANWDVWYFFVPFFMTEIAFFILFILWGHLLWNKRHHPPAGLDRPVDLSVDIFIPCCAEPLDIIERTVAAATRITYQKKIIHILDDGSQEVVRELAERLGVNYIRREGCEDRKAGNLNHALGQTSGDLILALDADQVAAPEIIDRIIGYFSLPYMAFVQTPQTFELPENDLFAEAYRKVTELGSKAVIVAETASAEGGGDKASWIGDMFDQLTAGYPRIEAVFWFDIDKECDWRLHSSGTVLELFKDRAARLFGAPR